MPKFPEPPPVTHLATISPELRTLPAGSPLWRIYFRAGRHPTAWNSFRSYGPVATARFDHHTSPAHEQERAILYAALDGATCVAEVFQETRTIERALYEPWLVGFELDHDLMLLDLMGSFSTAVGASTAMFSGPRRRAQRWSQAFYEAYPEAQGLLYPSSMYGNSPALALYERAQGYMRSQPFWHHALDTPALLGDLQRMARSMGYALR